MKCTEKKTRWFQSVEHDWRIIRVITTYRQKPSCLEEICRLCRETRIRYSEHSTDFWIKLKSEQPEDRGR